MRLRLLASIALSCMLLPAQKAPFTADALLQIKRVADPQMSPDAKWVAFTVSTIDVEKNTRPRQIWIAPLAGGAPKQITTEGNNDNARWSPDSKQLAFISTRGGTSQIWTMDPDGANAKQVTKLASEASGVKWSPDGKNLVFVSEVYPSCNADDSCNAAKIEAVEKSKVKARIYTTLLYRHWTEWRGERRKHLMVVAPTGGAVRDLTTGFQYDVPPFSLDGSDDYEISPDGNELVYAANLDEDQALSTNWEIYTVPIAGGDAKKISTSPGADASPKYSPDGKWIAWRMQVRAGYESDRWRLVVFNRETSQINVLTENMDRHVTNFTWHPDSKRIAIMVDDRGRQNVQILPVTGGGAKVLLQGSSHIDEVQFSADDKLLVYSEQSGSGPEEIFKAVKGGGAPVAVTHLNDALLAHYDLRPMEEFTTTGAEGAQVHSFLLKPPAFDAKKKYPVLMAIHGGPQGSWGESWTYRWNAQVFAAAGFVVVMPNPRGSTGYGTKFTDEINGDWGGKAYDDIMAVTDAVAKLPYVDAERMAAAGGSYGGYMVDWILGHTDRFKALISHAGVYDLRSEAGATEELWFTNWENKGFPWEQPELYEKWSPSAYAKNFKTPTLVIHGELDFRVPYGQGLQLFTALQAQKIPSKLIVFPDEGHWVLKPQNSLLWYKSFIDWLTEWTAKK
jgi:dipeptidyl aminopeptidase/acylaminoacyl peptidase